jgi:hypothetical protein
MNRICVIGIRRLFSTYCSSQFSGFKVMRGYISDRLRATYFVLCTVDRYNSSGAILLVRWDNQLLTGQSVTIRDLFYTTQEAGFNKTPVDPVIKAV